MPDTTASVTGALIHGKRVLGCLPPKSSMCRGGTLSTEKAAPSRPGWMLPLLTLPLVTLPLVTCFTLTSAFGLLLAVMPAPFEPEPSTMAELLLTLRQTRGAGTAALGPPLCHVLALEAGGRPGEDLVNFVRRCGAAWATTHDDASPLTPGFGTKAAASCSVRMPS